MSTRKPSSKAILQQLAEREVHPFQLSSYLFKEQLDFVLDPAYFKIAVTSRRAGKTVSCAADLTWTALEYPDTISLYLTLSRNNAKKLIWPELKRIARKFKLSVDFNESELSATFPNDSIIYCSGASDRTEIEKFRGLAIKKAYIDEGQSFPAYIKDLIDDVLSPALMDHDGTLSMIGTPGPVPSGFFFESSHSTGWSKHKWTFFNNPFIIAKSGKTHMEMLQRVLEQRGVDIHHPSVQREYFGNWVTDVDSLVYHYEPTKNHYQELPKGTYTYILGVDLGFNDADAIAVLAYNDASKATYLVEEKVTRKQGISDLVDQIEQLRGRYEISKIIMDQGGLGKKIAEEVVRRWKLPVEAAEKHRKNEFIELFNDSMRTGQFMANHNTQFADECQKVEWDLEKSTPDRKVISKRFHSDICEAVLYAWRFSMSYTYTKPVPKPVEGSKQWTEDLEEAAFEHFTKQAEEDEWWNQK